MVEIVVRRQFRLLVEFSVSTIYLPHSLPPPTPARMPVRANLPGAWPIASPPYPGLVLPVGVQQSMRKHLVQLVDRRGKICVLLIEMSHALILHIFIIIVIK